MGGLSDPTDPWVMNSRPHICFDFLDTWALGVPVKGLILGLVGLHRWLNVLGYVFRGIM